MSTVRLRGIHKQFGSSIAVHPLDLDVAEGEFLTLLGPSGCGKTTTLRMIAGFVTPTGGRLLLDDEDITAVPPQKRNMGMVFQDYSLFPHMTVEQNIAFGLVERKVPAARRAARVRELLELIRLPDIADRFPSEISGGQQQRVALARAVAHPPRTLLMDEPLGALDAKLRETMQQELRSIQKALSITTIFVTHDQSEAMSMSDRIAVMNGGRIEQIDVPNALYERPRTRFVADFVGKINFLDATLGPEVGDATIDGLPLKLAQDKVAWSPGRLITVGLRPERIALTVPGQSVPGAYVWSATVERVIYLGNMMHVEVKLPHGRALLIETAPATVHAGDAVQISFMAADLVVIRDESY